MGATEIKDAKFVGKEQELRGKTTENDQRHGIQKTNSLVVQKLKMQNLWEKKMKQGTNLLNLSKGEEK